MNKWKFTYLLNLHYKLGVMHLLPTIRIRFNIEEKEFEIYFAWLVWRLEYRKWQ